MSVPPQVIRVKRKLTEDEPVAFLRFQDNKRHRGEGFAYQRQQDIDANTSSSTQQAIASRPIIHPRPPKTSNHDAASQRPQEHNKKSLDDTKKTTALERGRPSGDHLHPVWSRKSPELQADATTASEIRRFHMSRKETILRPSSALSSHSRGVSKKRYGTAVFVERRIKSLPPRRDKTAGTRIERRTASPLSRSLTPELASSGSASFSALPGKADESAPMPRKFKKPGVSRIHPKEGTSSGKPELPASMMNRWNVDVEKLTADMNEFAMESIKLNLQKAEEERKRQESRATRQQPKYMPKKPALRYAERHPETAVDTHKGHDMTDATSSSDEDENYVTETYVRVPVSTIDQKGISPSNIGLLVFDEEPDLELFCEEYGSDEDSPEDDEDENAEDYYANDYPDEELASDDEFDRNPYNYHENDFGESDDEKDLAHYSDSEDGLARFRR